MSTVQLGAYCYLSVPLMIPLLWVVAEVLEGLGAGVDLSLTYRQ